MTTPVTQVLLHIEEAFQTEIVTETGLKLFLDPSYNKNFNVTVTAKIAALPLNPNPKDKHILESLKVGDEVAISYRIAAELTFEGDGGRYMEATEKNDYVREFINGKGEWIRVYALPKRSGFKGIMWAAVHENKKREFIDGTQGSEDEVERWLSQFPFGKTDNYTFDNFFEYEKKDYWKCNPSDIFAKKVKGHLVSIGDRIICKPVEEDVPAEFLQNIQHHSSVKIRFQDRGRIISGGKELGLKKDTIISFNQQFCEKYNFWGKDYYLINKRYVQGIWN